MTFHSLLSRFMLAVGLIFGSCPSFSQSVCNNHLLEKKLSYSERLEGIFSQRNSESLSRDLQLFISGLWSNNHKFSKQDISKVYNEYLNLRLKEFDSELQEQIRSIIRNRLSVVGTKKLRVGGSASSQSNRIKIVMPEPLLETVIDYSIRVHEIEHIIQNLTVGIRSGAENPMHPRFVQLRFSLEKGAMQAEGAFLMAFPRDFLEGEVENLIELSKTKPKKVEFLVNTLRNSIEATTVSEYLEKTWKQGRYSHSQLFKGQIFSYAIFPGGIPIFLFLEPYISSFF